jgi:hypothetical protein
MQITLDLERLGNEAIYRNEIILVVFDALVGAYSAVLT